jgi:hypothetical protein
MHGRVVEFMICMLELSIIGGVQQTLIATFLWRDEAFSEAVSEDARRRGVCEAAACFQVWFRGAAGQR